MYVFCLSQGRRLKSEWHWSGAGAGESEELIMLSEKRREEKARKPLSLPSPRLCSLWHC